MQRRNLIVTLAVLIALAFAAVVVASTMGGDDAVHNMPDGQTMEGMDMPR